MILGEEELVGLLLSWLIHAAPPPGYMFSLSVHAKRKLKKTLATT